MAGTSRLFLQARGDPFMGAVFKGLGSLAGRAFNALLPRPVTPAVRTSTPSLPGGGVAMANIPALQAGQKLGNRAIPGLIPQPRGGSAAQFGRVLAGGSSTAALVGQSMGRRRRRMNPANIRALRRSISRVTSFERLASKVLHLTRRGTHVAGFKRKARRKR